MNPFALTETEIIMRIALAVLLGLLVGAERSRVGKRAGMRTYALVSLGSALFTMISIMVSNSSSSQYAIDPLRIASQIVVGIGFLGAGVIFARGPEVSGLTTAAGLWVVAGVGMAAGFGYYMLATFVAIIMLVVFEALWYVEDKFIKHDHDNKEPQ